MSVSAGTNIAKGIYFRRVVKLTSVKFLVLQNQNRGYFNNFLHEILVLVMCFFPILLHTNFPRDKPIYWS